MGKWTPNYVDDVLHSKISSLVTGAIRRASVEKEPSISYENFVTELDIGDSFTTSIIDILVKEVADRRTRTNPNERRLISDKTMRSLRLLANTTRAYSSRAAARSHSRRAVNLSNLTEYFTTSPQDLDLDDDDDDDFMTDHTLPIEGARVNTDLYDAFSTNPWSSSAITRRITASPSPAADDWLPPPLRSPTSTTRPWAASSSTTSTSNPSSTLSRQASIRRAARQRYVDFNEMTNRRRATNRGDLPPPRPEVPESVTEPRDNLSTNSQTVRRFFPFPRSRRHQSAPNHTWSDLDTLSSSARHSNADGEIWMSRPDSEDRIPPEFAIWYDVPQEPSVSPDVENPEETESLLRAPRLRMGSIRPPETMLSRHASPIIISTPPIEAFVVAPTTIARAEETSSALAINEEPTAYPTPGGSTENESVA